MRNKIENLINISVCGIDLTTLTNIEFYIRQGNTFLQYTPQILDASNMLVTIPVEDAKKLVPITKAELQFAFTDDNNNKGASDITRLIVQELIKKGSYPND